MTLLCTETRARLDDALDGRFDAAAQAAFDRHVASCASCAAEWEIAGSLRGSLLRIGLEPAPARLRESVGAAIRRSAPRRAAVPVWMRVAASIVLVVGIGWVMFRPGKLGEVRDPATPRDGTAGATAAGPEAPQPPQKPADAKPADALARGEAVSAPLVKPVPLPEGGPNFGASARPTSPAVERARALADAGAAAGEDLDRLATAGAPPEERLRQAEVLVLLSDNLRGLAQAAGDVPALTQLAKDADRALVAFVDNKKAGPAKGQPDPAGKPAPGDEADLNPSALKVVPADRSEGGGQPVAGGSAGRAQRAAPRGPAFYVVSGPAAPGRAQRILSDRGFVYREVWLKDRSENEKQRKAEEQATGYRIVEVNLPAAAVKDLLADLAALDSCTLKPVSQAAQTASAPAPADGAESRAAGSKPLEMRKLRLVLVGR